MRATSSSESEVDDDVGFDQFAAERSLLGVTSYDDTPGGQILPVHLVATNASDLIRSRVTPSFFDAFASGLVLVKYGHELWRVERAPIGKTDHLEDGFDIAEVAIAPDGRVTVLDTRARLEVSAPRSLTTTATSTRA